LFEFGKERFTLAFQRIYQTVWRLVFFGMADYSRGFMQGWIIVGCNSIGIDLGVFAFLSIVGGLKDLNPVSGFCCRGLTVSDSGDSGVRP
jgi:hypothetical protein